MKSKLFILLIAVGLLAFCGLLNGCSKKKETVTTDNKQVTTPESNVPSSANPKLQRAVEKSGEAQSEQRRSREQP